MEELKYKRIFYYIFIIFNVLCLIFSHVTSATTNSGSVLEESQIQTNTPMMASLSTIPSYYTSATSKDFQIAPTSTMVLRESYLPQVSSDALPQTISDIAPLNTNVNDRGSQSFSMDSESLMSTSESRAIPLESSDGLSGILAKQSFASSDIVQVSDPMPSVMDMTSTNIVPTSSVMDVMSSNIVPILSVIHVDVMSSNILPTLPVIESDVMSNVMTTLPVINVVSTMVDLMSSDISPTSTLVDLMSSDISPTSTLVDLMSPDISPTSTLVDLMSSEILPTSTLVDLMSSDTLITQTNDLESIQSKAESMLPGLASSQSQTRSILNTNNLSPSILQFSSTIEISDFVPDSVATSESETMSNEQSIFGTITEISVPDLSSELLASTETSSVFVSDFNSAQISSDTESVLSRSDLSYMYSSIQTNSYSDVSTELLESQTGDLTQSGITAFPTTVSSEILFPVSSHGSGEIISSQASYFVSYSSLIIESSTSFETPESTSPVISPSSILVASSLSSSILVNETMPVPEKNTGGLTQGGKVALGICIPIIIVLVIAAIVFFAYRRRYHTATWKLTDVVSYRPWSYSNASYYDDESTLIVSGLDK